MLVKRTMVFYWFLTFTSLLVCGQTRQEKRLALNLWHPGEVILLDGEVVKGDINFNYIMNIIRVEVDTTVLAFNHKQFTEFWVFKSEEDRKVYYKSLVLPMGDKVYEIVGEDDEKALLVTTVIDQETRRNPEDIYLPFRRSRTYTPPPGEVSPTGPNNVYVINRKAEEFYIITNTGVIHELGKIVMVRNNGGELSSTISRKNLIKVLKPYKPDIKDYLKKNKINTRKRSQLIDTFMSILKAQ